jgi:hypothetical protein
MIQQKLTIKGPFRWKGGEPSLFDAVEIKDVGVYIWTIPWEGRYLTNYVGMTNVSFYDRLKTHETNWHNGLYRIYNSDKLADGIHDYFWEGLGLSYRRAIMKDLENEFESNRAVYEDMINQLLTLYRIFLIPIDVPDEVGREDESGFIKRIEDGVVIDLHLNSKLVKTFYDNWDIYSHSYKEGRIEVEFEGFEQIIGLSNEILC